MKKEQVLNCMFANWYPLFKNVTIRSVILSISEPVVQYLKSDGVILPKGCDKNDPSERGQSDLSSDEEGWDDAVESESPSFPEFEAAVRNAIAQLGGKVFPKLNWSSPKDAIWISCDNTLKCVDPGDIFLLLKSSTFITHDLTQPFVHCDDGDKEAYEVNNDNMNINYTLVLREWIEINPGNEFRCFVKNRKLIGISQRHPSMYHPSIETDEKEIVSDILDFHENKIGDKFVDTDYVMDVYWQSGGKIILLDFNPFGHVTDGLLFVWNELEADVILQEQGEINKPAFRYVAKQAGVQPDPCHRYGLPQDFVDLSTGEDVHKLIDFMKLQQLGQQASSSSSDEENP